MPNIYYDTVKNPQPTNRPKARLLAGDLVVAEAFFCDDASTIVLLWYSAQPANRAVELVGPEEFAFRVKQAGLRIEEVQDDPIIAELMAEVKRFIEAIELNYADMKPGIATYLKVIIDGWSGGVGARATLLKAQAKKETP